MFWRYVRRTSSCRPPSRRPPGEDEGDKQLYDVQLSIPLLDAVFLDELDELAEHRRVERCSEQLAQLFAGHFGRPGMLQSFCRDERQSPSEIVYDHRWSHMITYGTIRGHRRYPDAGGR